MISLPKNHSLIDRKLEGTERFGPFFSLVMIVFDKRPVSI